MAIDSQKVSYNQYKFIIDSVNDIIFQTDNEGAWTFLNKSWERSMSYTVEESIGKPFFSFLYPDDVAKNWELFKPMIEGSKPYCKHEIRYQSSKSEIRWMRVYAVLLKDDAGNVIGTSGTLSDISQEKQNRDMIDLLSNNISDLVAVHELDGTYKYLSPSVKSITGYTEAEMLGKSPYGFILPADVDKLKQAHISLLKNRTQVGDNITWRFVTKSGGYTWLETVSKMIVNDFGDDVGIVTSSRVVDLRKKAEEHLIISAQKERELNQLKSNFINLASHEFRTPLAIMHSSMELLEIAVDMPVLNRKLIDKHKSNIFAEIDRLNSLIDDVLITGKIESNGIVCNIEPIDITALVKHAVGSIEDIQPDKRKIDLQISGEPREVLADQALMRQVLFNLLSNAFKYSSDCPPPVLTLIFSDDAYTIKLKDFGIGIPDSDQKKIFSAFYRASNAGQIKGTGLGMFITKTFVELQHGQIHFESYKGFGTEFTLIFQQRAES
jgi:PAS domain S-box-containing protein